MRRALLILLGACLVVAAAWGIHSLPGTVSADIGPYSFTASSPVAATLLVVLFVLIYVIGRLLGFLLFMPRRLRRWQDRRNRRYGDLAVTRALVALAAGESGDARREAGRARRLLGDTPQALLLAAEAGHLAGREDEAEAAFRALARQPDAAFLGLRGLLRQAVAREDWTAAAAIARQAESAHPAAAWLRQERSALALRTGNWIDAVGLADADAPKAALAAAASGQAGNGVQRLHLARQAWKEDRTLPAAAIAYAVALRADGRSARALAVLRESWERAPHPDIAACYLQPLHDGASRLDAAKRLTKHNPTNVESRLVLARTSLEAGKLDDARFHADAARNTGLNQQRLWRLMADIADAEGGDSEAGRIARRDAMRLAATAEPDPVWHCTACGTPHATWHPVCPACGKPATLRWGAPTAILSTTPILTARAS
ncbi:MAG: heme biosynthesis protein HemY [Proteobacteria bacterium]|nr:heme biosynthesis protein HemY [Pseudomonadota bacterium]